MSDANIICHDVDLLGDWLDSRGYTEEAGLCLRVLGLIHEQAEDNEKLREERHELKNELAKWVNYWRDKDVKALRAENEKLRAALKEAAILLAKAAGQTGEELFADAAIVCAAAAKETDNEPV